MGRATRITNCLSQGGLKHFIFSVETKVMGENKPIDGASGCIAKVNHWVLT